jgi:outer membrane receptor protein involved in Fe transport
MGLNELDAESLELIPGAASALYGPNAFNGIMIMKSKSPFDYQGLSMQVKQGVTNSKAGGNHPLGLYTIRYAKAFNNKFAFKLNFSYLEATDWLSNDYKTDRNNPESKTDLSSSTNFDGLNLYGDEPQIPVGALTGIPSLGVITRTGFREEDALDNRKARTIKGDAALHYRISDKIEAIYAYRYGGGNSIYQGAEKYALRDFNQQFHKIEFKGDNFFLRSYLSATDAGKSYNLSALGIYANETYSPSATSWIPDYALAMQGYAPGYAAGNPSDARKYADRNRPIAGTQDYTDLMNAVRGNYFQQSPSGTWKGKPVQGGSSFKDNSKIWHTEFNYIFKDVEWADIMVGGNFRQYSLFTHGTVLNEAPDDANAVKDFKRIFINQYGVYTQVAKSLAESLKITGSIRYDKSDNFEGHFTPRISAVYSPGENHNIRASFQTGFRIPDTQAQYIYFPSSTGILLGSTKDNAERYGVMNGLSYSQTSYNAYLASGGAIDPNSTSGTATTNGATVGGNPALLQTVNIPYVKPEQLQAFEIGYKGLFATNMFVDLNYYYSSYTGFIGSQLIVSKNKTSHQGQQVDAGTLWAPSVNATEKVTSQGVGVGLTYNLPRNFSINGNYNWAAYSANESGDFRAGFNTPKNRYSIGLSNRKVTKNIGFNVNFRYQDMFHWTSSYGEWDVPRFGVVDAQVSYKLAPIKTVIKLGGTNIGGGDYRTSLGGPFVGQQYYVSVTFDEFLK